MKPKPIFPRILVRRPLQRLSLLDAAPDDEIPQATQAFPPATAWPAGLAVATRVLPIPPANRGLTPGAVGILHSWLLLSAKVRNVLYISGPPGQRLHFNQVIERTEAGQSAR